MSEQPLSLETSYNPFLHDNQEIPMGKTKKEIIDQYVKMHEEYSRVLKQAGVEKLHIFNKFVLNVEKGKVPLAPVHKKLAKFIQDNTKKKKLILMPRGHLKSTLVTIGYSVQQIAKNPNIRILLLSATWQMAVDFLTEIKNNLTRNETFIDLYGELAQDPTEWSQDRITLKRTDMNIKGPTVWAAGIDSNLVGSHPDMIIFDDVVNRDNCNTRESIDKVILRYKDALDLLEPGGQLIVIGTRWVEGDLYDWIMDPSNEIHRSFDVMVEKSFEGNIETGDGFKALWPEKFSLKELRGRLREKGWYEFSCTPAQTPILMSDWTSKRIEDVREGDTVVGFERGTGVYKNRLVQSKVLKTFSKWDTVYQLKMESGRVIECTEDHRWYTGRKDKTHPMYAPAKEGKKLSYVCDPYSELKLSSIADWSYLAGIIDGEGSFRSGGSITISQDSVKNKGVWESILAVLKRLNLEYGVFTRGESNKMLWIKDSFNTQLKLIRNINFGKKDQAIKRLYRKGGRFVREKDKVLSIKKKKKEMVFALETETGNYVAWGYASSNSQYQNDPVPDQDADFKRSWFQYYDREELKGKEMMTIMSIDPAIALKKTSDFTAMVVVGIDAFTSLFVRDVVRGHWRPNEIIDNIFNLYELYHPRIILLETVAYQQALSYALREEMQKRGTYLPIHEIRYHEVNKDQRIRGLQPIFMNKKVWFPKGLRMTPYLEEELLKFPRAKHDDMIDALSMTLDYLVPPRQKKTAKKQKYLY